jgi:excisionase family DNA binding protein
VSWLQKGEKLMQGNEVSGEGGAPIDLVRGVKAIAKLLGMSERQTYHLLESGHLPGAFKLGRAWCVRKKTLVEGLRRLEQGVA